MEEFVSEQAKRNYEMSYSYFSKNGARPNNLIVRVCEFCLNKFSLAKDYSNKEKEFEDDFKLACMRGLDELKKWQVLKYYSENVEKATWEKAYKFFTDDLKNIIAKSKGFKNFTEFEIKVLKDNEQEEVM